MSPSPLRDPLPQRKPTVDPEGKSWCGIGCGYSALLYRALAQVTFTSKRPLYARSSAEAVKLEEVRSREHVLPHANNTASDTYLRSWEPSNIPPAQ